MSKIACKIGHQCKYAVCLFSVNGLQLGKRSEKVLHATRWKTKKKLKMHERSCCLSRPRPYFILWIQQRNSILASQQATTRILCRLSLTFYSGGTSTPLLGDSLSGPHSHTAGWACLFPAVAAAAASSSSSARVRSSPRSPAACRWLCVSICLCVLWKSNRKLQKAVKEINQLINK